MEGLSGTEDMLGSMTGLRQWKVLRVQVTFSARDADLHQRRKGSGVWGLLWG